MLLDLVKIILGLMALASTVTLVTAFWIWAVAEDTEDWDE